MPKVKYLGGASHNVQVDDVELVGNGEAVEVSTEQLARLQAIEGAQLEVDGKVAAPAATPVSGTTPVQGNVSSDTTSTTAGGKT